MSILADYNMPFAAALVLMALLAIVQLFGLDFGGDADVDADLDTDGGDIGSGLASLLGLGRVPLTIWLAVFLLFFAVIGVSIQSLAFDFAGGALNRWLAAAIAGLGALPITGIAARPLSRILPRDETTAVGLDTLVGRRAEVTTGTARAQSAARSRVYDHHGNPHYVMVEPQDQGAEISEGEKVLLVRREGELFFGTKLEERRLAPIH